MHLRRAIRERLFGNLCFSSDGREATGAAAAQVCGRLRPRVAPGHVRLWVDAASTYTALEVSHAPLPQGDGGADDIRARGMLESLRATIVGTNHGCRARYLLFYAVEHVARFVRMPFEAMLCP